LTIQSTSAVGTADPSITVVVGNALTALSVDHLGVVTASQNFIGSANFNCTSGGTSAGGALQFGTSAANVVSAATGAQLDINAGVYTKLSMAGDPYFPGHTTTASAANAFLDSGSSPVGRLLRSTSSARYKTAVEDLYPWLADAVVAKARPVWYRSTAEADRPDWSWYGLIAEELALIDPRLVQFGYADEDMDRVPVVDAQGKPILGVDGGPRFSLEPKKGAQKRPDGVQYERLTVILLSAVQRLEARVRQLEGLA
jgi:hypothetical protein